MIYICEWSLTGLVRLHLRYSPTSKMSILINLLRVAIRLSDTPSQMVRCYK